MTRANYKGEDMVIAVDVDKIYANKCHALKKVSVTVKRGEVVVIIGPSGSGN